MKKTISILFLSLAASLAAYASPVDGTAAEKTAKAFFGTKGSLQMVWSGDQATKNATVICPSYYVFNNPAGGWVIIAGDDCCEPVLAYSRTDSFDASNLPSNFRVWMGGIDKNVRSVREAGMTPKPAIKAKWASVGAVKADVGQKCLETASWGQEAPFYNSCPKHNSKYCLTGCVATAMAIVLRYNKYPAKGTGTIPAYTTGSNSIKVSAIALGAAYDWENMPLVYGSGATSAQKSAVATLMLHCGAMVEMDYDPDGSAAYSSDIIPALTKYMGYSKAARELYRYNYSNTDWFNMIKAEIDANRPLIYGGADADTEDGHQFVLDGYDDNNMVHINWGWTGSCNAWYAVNYLGDKTSVQDVFSYGDSALIGLEPEQGASSQSVELSLESDTDNSQYGISLSSGSIAKGSSFSVKIGNVCNYDYYNSYSGAVKIGLYDRNGNLKEYVSSEKSLSLDAATADSQGYLVPAYTSMTFTCTVNTDIVLGDYLMAVYKLTDDSWAILGGYNSDEFTDSSYEFYTLYKLGVMDLAFLNLPSTVSAGQLIYFDLVGSHKLPSSIKWYWDNTVNSKRFVEATSGTHSLKAAVTYSDGSTETVQKVINVQ